MKVSAIVALSFAAGVFAHPAVERRGNCFPWLNKAERDVNCGPVVEAEAAPIEKRGNCFPWLNKAERDVNCPPMEAAEE